MRAHRISGSVLVSALFLAGCGADSSPKAASPAAASPSSARPAAAQPDPGKLEILSVLSVEREVDVLAERSGVVMKLNSEQGSYVKKGAVLAQIDDRDLVAQVDRARADVAVAQNNVRFNEAELRAKQAAYRRAQEMFKLGLNSQADLEEAEFRAKGAEFDLQAWRAMVERNQASLRALEVELERSRIRSPFDGVVARRYIHLGQNVLKDEKGFRISQLTPLIVHFLVPESSGKRPRVGDTIEVMVASDGQANYSARIETVGPTVDAASASFEVRARLTGSTSNLKPGMSARILWPAAAAPTRQ